MSGWLLIRSDLVFGLFMMFIGVLQLLPVRQVPTLIDRRAGALKLRYGDGGVDVPAGRHLPRWPGFAMIALGAMHLLWPRPGHPDRVLMLIMGALLLGLALLSLPLGARFAARRQRRYEAELDQLAARADLYAEADYQQELRALHANRPIFVSPLRTWLFTGFAAVFGATFLTLGLTEARA